VNLLLDAAMDALAAREHAETAFSALAPAGRASRALAELGWSAMIPFALVALAMWALLAWVAWRRTGSFTEHEPPDESGGERWVHVGGIALPLVAFSVVFVLTLRTLAAFPMECGQPAASAWCAPDGRPDARVTGHQWWWQVQYLRGDLPGQVFSANELHVPVGQPFDIELVSDDVIHSFWVPRLHGKVDLVPGMQNRIRLEAEEPGVYGGECAEFCGQQHTRMRFVVVAQTVPDFERWLASQREPAPAPAEPAAQRGQAIFEQSSCSFCHTLRGTGAHGSVGPDLTHFASRSLIAASFPNDVATLHAWVTNAQSLKPGARMPTLPLFQGGQLHDLVAYLRTLE
jgi:cytochrome c oxidase subunit 2